jgi:hypothetical protein
VTRDKLYFTVALLLFVPAIAMSFSAAFAPTYAHALAMLSFVFMILGTMATFLGFKHSS